MKSLKDLFTGRRKKEGLVTVSSQDERHDFYPSSNHQPPTTTLYQCPMGCEGDKTYDSPGNCPVCNMSLIPVVENNSNLQKHKHQGNNHGHHHCCC